MSLLAFLVAHVRASLITVPSFEVLNAQRELDLKIVTAIAEFAGMLLRLPILSPIVLFCFSFLFIDLYKLLCCTSL